jgi:hypothetical protein
VGSRLVQPMLGRTSRGGGTESCLSGGESSLASHSSDIEVPSAHAPTRIS